MASGGGALSNLSPGVRLLVGAGIVLFPVGFLGGWWVRQREHDALMTDLLVEARVRERLGEVVPVEIAPQFRKELEKERDEIRSKLAALEEKRRQRNEAQRLHEAVEARQRERRPPAEER